ncbi:MAG TPA: hypothetical protein VNE21_05330, partial [Mycobacteriales bacterium]|nr:hypothetical protein [Mycobacteriales bacterium]
MAVLVLVVLVLVVLVVVRPVLGGRVMTQSNRVRLVALGALVAAVIGALSAGWGHPAWWALPALTLAVAASEIAVVHLAFGRQRWTFSLSEGAIAAAFLLSGGAWCAVAVALGVLLAQAVRHQPALKLHFNVAQFAAGASLGAALSSHLGGGVPGAVAGMGVFWLVNNLLVAGAVSIMSRRSLLGLLWASAPLAAVHSAGTSSLGLLAAWLAVHAPLGLLALVVPLVLLWLSYDEQTSRAAEVRLFA